MTRLIALVLRLYPARIRERYGDELTEMLTASPRRARDLIDVIGCALTDRMEQARIDIVAYGLGRAAGRLALALVLPLLLINAGRLANAELLNALRSTGHMPLHARTPVMMLATILLAGAAATAGRLLIRGTAAAGFAAAVCAFVITVYVRGWPWEPAGPIVDAVYHPYAPSYRRYMLVMVLAWAVGVWALALWVRSLTRRGRGRLAVIVTVVGGLILVDVLFAGCVIAQTLDWLAQDPYSQQPSLRFYSFAPLWYPTLLSEGGLLFNSTDGRFGLSDIILLNGYHSPGPWNTGLLSPIGSAMGSIPLILTICTAYVLGQATVRSSPHALRTGGASYSA